MENLKPFDPNEIDETLTRVVTHDGKTYLMFPYISGLGAVPQFTSISRVIDGPAATIGDFSSLSALLRQATKNSRWFISFNTPWLLSLSEAGNVAQRTPQNRANRP
jgi:hypothetical protein